MPLFFAGGIPGMLHDGLDGFFSRGAKLQLIELLLAPAEHGETVAQLNIGFQRCFNSGLQAGWAFIIEIKDKILFFDLFHSTFTCIEDTAFT